MKKTLYSLMLDDAVVREIDLLAHRSGTNRSNLVNQILADYVHLTTPERRVSDIFGLIGEMMGSQPEIVPFFAPNTNTMSLKSALEYKYRPTVRYEVELFRSPGSEIGTVSVIFRTQSRQLLDDMTLFFRLWTTVEDAHLTYKPTYALYDGKFVRNLGAPQGDRTTRQLAQAITDYIRLFDRCMKGFLSGGYGPAEVENEYIKYLRT